MNYKEAMEYVSALSKYGSVLGLENMNQLCKRLGNPQDDFPVVHIAGTNGKGSVAAYLSTVLTEAGYKTGRYISPVISEYREMIQINSRLITKKALCEGLELLKVAAEDIVREGGNHPTIFEMETALAFWYFKKTGCDIVVLETGLGGTLDATNVVKRTLAAVITSISMDHMQFLGDNLASIARNKAGIMKPGSPVVTIRQEEEAMAVLREEAKAKSCPLTVMQTEKLDGIKYGIKKQRFSYQGVKNLEITMAGKHQIENAALAVEALLVLSTKGFPVTKEQMKRGLLCTQWKGRFTVLAEKPFFIADGAHNEDAAIRLADSVKFYFKDKKILFIMGVLRDKKYDLMLQKIYRLAAHIITVTPPGNPRALSAYELARAAGCYHGGVTAADSLEEAVELSYLLADKDTVIIAFGSLSYMGKIITLVRERDQIRRDSHGK